MVSMTWHTAITNRCFPSIKRRPTVPSVSDNTPTSQFHSHSKYKLKMHVQVLSIFAMFLVPLRAFTNCKTHLWKTFQFPLKNFFVQSPMLIVVDKSWTATAWDGSLTASNQFRANFRGWYRWNCAAHTFAELLSSTKVGSSQPLTAFTSTCNKT